MFLMSLTIASLLCLASIATHLSQFHVMFELGELYDASRVMGGSGRGD
jgi:hypothetical protein